MLSFCRIIAGCKQRLLELENKRLENASSILMFHEVIENGQTAIYPEISITKEHFIEMLDVFEQNEAKIVSVESMINEPGPYVVITFDDIFENAYINAFPILNERKIPYTVFITAGYVDQPGYITSAGLEELKTNELCTIGFHANSHLMMRNLSKIEIEQNVIATQFEEKHGVSCDYFAFPFGSVYACPPKAIRIVSRKGYKCIFSTINNYTSSNAIRSNSNFVPRICMTDTTYRKYAEKFTQIPKRESN